MACLITENKLSYILDSMGLTELEDRESLGDLLRTVRVSSDRLFVNDSPVALLSDIDNLDILDDIITDMGVKDPVVRGVFKELVSVLRYNDGRLEINGDTVATLSDIPEEKDLKALRAYHYGSPYVTESPSEWFQFDTDTGTITGFEYIPGREHIIIPWDIGGVPVVNLDNFLSWDGNGVVSVIAPKSVTTVSNSFQDCNALTSVSLPNATTVDGSLFYCGVLTSVDLRNATLVNNSLQDCYALTNVIFSGSPPAIDEYTFGGSPATVYVDNPTATGWGAIFGRLPVVRLPLNTDKLSVTGPIDISDKVVDGEAGVLEYSDGSLLLDGTPVMTTETPVYIGDPFYEYTYDENVSGQVTIRRDMGNNIRLVLTGDCEIRMDLTEYPSNGVSRVTISIDSNGNPISFDVDTISFKNDFDSVDTEGVFRVLLVKSGNANIFSGALVE